MWISHIRLYNRNGPCYGSSSESGVNLPGVKGCIGAGWLRAQPTPQNTDHFDPCQLLSFARLPNPQGGLLRKGIPSTADATPCLSSTYPKYEQFQSNLDEIRFQSKMKIKSSVVIANGCIYASVGKVTVVSDYGLSFVLCQTIIWTNGLNSFGQFGKTMNFKSKHHDFYSRRSTWKYRPQNVEHFVSASIC